jgi:hypothetical protein
VKIGSLCTGIGGLDEAVMAVFGGEVVWQSEIDKHASQQGGTCPICELPPIEGKRLYVDHDHWTNKVRGLLCHTCNLMLGYADDDIVSLRRAISYLEKYK